MATLEWAVPQQSRLKYGQLFNTNDRQKSGFLTGIQARNILIQSGLPQQILAQIWFLADADKDGMLTNEEFILAMHLIDMCKSGKALPPQLPPELLPPTLRRKLSLVSPTLSDKGRITPNQTPTAARQGSISSVSSAGSNAQALHGIPSPVPTTFESAIPQASRLKYTQGFNTADKDRSGFLTGQQARGILIQSGLPQQTLAGIWNLSDIDKDGRLNLEEFILAMHLIDMVRSGEPLPTVLPIELVPVSYRRKQSLNGGPVVVPTATGAQIPVPVTVGGVPIPGTSPSANQIAGDATLGKHSFEDKRKENFEKGQAELEKRRQMLLDQQRREQEERDRKEREEQEKRERARLELERRKQEELERQMAKQRELEQQKEEERRKQLEQREAARREMERQRLIEWETQKKSEMILSKQRIQEQLIALKARKNSTSTEVNQQLSTIKEKVEEARTRVSAAKQEIDQMRVERDTRLREMNQLKLQLKQLQDRQLFIEQERIRLTAQLSQFQSNLGSTPGLGGDSTEFALQAKQNLIAQLKQRLQEIEPELQEKQKAFELSKSKLNELTEVLDKNVADVELVRNQNEKKREEAQVTTDEAAKIAEQATKMAANLDFNTGWDDVPPVASSTFTSSNATGVFESSDLSTSSGSNLTKNSSNTANKYRAIYDFQSENVDELSFKSGDIIELVSNETGVIGWLKGRLNSMEGWFPESYVQPLDDACDLSSNSANPEAMLEVAAQAVGSAEVATEESGTVHTEYEATDDTQLSLAQGEKIKVLDKSRPDWWFGQKGDRSGWFPSACVTLDNQADSSTEYFMSIYAFATQEPGDLSFEANELIRVTKREVEWWTGEIGNRTGIFPATFVRPATADEIKTLNQTLNTKVEEKPNVSVTEDPKTDNTLSRKVSFSDSARNPESPRLKKTKSKKPEIVRVIADYKATGDNQIDLEKGQLIQVRKKADSGWWEGEVQVKGKKRQIGWFPASYVKSLAAPTSDGSSTRSTPDSAIKDTETKKVQAVYPYTAQQFDELSFEAGEVIKVISEEDAVWWKGESETSGKIGLFPSNHVEPIRADKR